jgi:hypothetical protein
MPKRVKQRGATEKETISLRLEDGRKVKVTIECPADAAGQVRWSKIDNAVSISTGGADPLLLNAPPSAMPPSAPAQRYQPRTPFVSSSTLREDEDGEISDGIDPALREKLEEAQARGADIEELERIVDDHSASGGGRAPRHDRSAEILARTRQLATISDGKRSVTLDVDTEAPTM